MEVINFLCYFSLSLFALWLVITDVCLLIVTICDWVEKKSEHFARACITILFLCLIPFFLKFLVYCISLMMGY